MIMDNQTFEKIRFYAEIIGHILTFVLACSEIIGFKYGVELAGIIAAANIMIGGIVESSRRRWNNQGQELDELEREL